MLGNFWVAEQLVASQEGHGSMKFISAARKFLFILVCCQTLSGLCSSLSLPFSELGEGYWWHGKSSYSSSSNISSSESMYNWLSVTMSLLHAHSDVPHSLRSTECWQKLPVSLIQPGLVSWWSLAEFHSIPKVHYECSKSVSSSQRLGVNSQNFLSVQEEITVLLQKQCYGKFKRHLCIEKKS
jgi:hypothetical protein